MKISNPITLKTSSKLQPNKALIILLPGPKSKLPAWLSDQLPEPVKPYLVKVAANPTSTQLGKFWHIPTAHLELCLVTCGEKPLTRLGLDKLWQPLTACLQQLSNGKAQLFCDWLELQPADLSLQGAELNNYAREHIIMQLAQQAYKYEEYKTAKRTTQTGGKLSELTVLTAEPLKLRTRIKQLEATISGLNLAKDLANTPPNECNPPYLAKQGKDLAKQYKNLSCQVLGDQELKQLRMNAYLAVTDGSAHPPQLVTMHYKGAASQPPVVLVGKGMTFDTGGVSLKPSAQMDEMKYDMCGAAAVFGVMKIAAELHLPLNLVGLCAGAENSLDGAAYRPGDIIRTRQGTTVEVLNTDAEGRLVLCDVLAYASRFKPHCVIDLATLTGACIVALGSLRSALCANDDKLAAQLEAAGAKSQDLVWRLPLDQTYLEDLRTNFADIANVGNRAAGTITAAGFLAKFATKYSWAHLDIAGSAWLGGARKGATGRPVQLLTQFLLDLSRSKSA